MIFDVIKFVEEFFSLRSFIFLANRRLCTSLLNFCQNWLTIEFIINYAFVLFDFKLFHSRFFCFSRPQLLQSLKQN